METKELSERRSADRKKMAAAVAALVIECGATADQEENGSYPGPQAIQLRVKAAQGLQVTVEFDGKSCQPNVYVLSWHMGYKATARLNNSTFGGNVNPYHKQKATYVAHGFKDLCGQLKDGLLMAADGTAFLTDELATPPAVVHFTTLP